MACGDPWTAWTNLGFQKNGMQEIGPAQQEWTQHPHLPPLLHLWQTAPWLQLPMLWVLEGGKIFPSTLLGIPLLTLSLSSRFCLWTQDGGPIHHHHHCCPLRSGENPKVTPALLQPGASLSGCTGSWAWLGIVITVGGSLLTPFSPCPLPPSAPSWKGGWLLLSATPDKPSTLCSCSPQLVYMGQWRKPRGGELGSRDPPAATEPSTLCSHSWQPPDGARQEWPWGFPCPSQLGAAAAVGKSPPTFLICSLLGSPRCHLPALDSSCTSDSVLDPDICICRNLKPPASELHCGKGVQLCHCTSLDLLWWTP